METKRFQDKTDEELIEMLRAGQSEIMDFLLEKYKNLVRKKANAMFLLGGDTDDLIQEGMIGLFKAIRDYDTKKGGNFFGFANLCVNRQIYSAVEAAARKKHGPLNSYVSLSGEDGEDADAVLFGNGLINQNKNPENLLISQEDLDIFWDSLEENLSSMEKKVLDAYLSGMNYRQIAEKLGKTEKSVDNALQRIKSKVSKIKNGKK
ncbi:MAG TPA: RNA polymerase sporulation sigma factor SigH [Candidatus Eubacterium avistercoris]|uniref:RNA polymerase sigma factor SigS n=1 Tax=Candidatus Eubacterium avistercoris TaxID=2838567 RepID=A0A9D2IFZ2_9FIRM|nr:RNA polymerase sporulation sigma factor SigH [Candidatus Eubacterium avistercoris]